MPPKVSPLRVASDAIPTSDRTVSLPTSKPKLIWLYGSTGSGKSYYIRTRYPNAFVKRTDSNWKGYQGESVVAIEDFSFETRKLFQLTFLRWLTEDYIPVYVKPYKKRCIKPTTFIVTSYYHPTDFKHLKPFIKQLLSNCEIINCTFISPPSHVEMIYFNQLPEYHSDSEEYEVFTQVDPDKVASHVADSDDESQIN